MPLASRFHHSQLPAMPLRATKPVTTSGVSAANVVATIGVLPGGCSGFRYSLSIEDKPAEDDLVIESAGVRCFVDGFSAQYLNGVTLDYKSNFQESGFAFENPNATGGCGCGSSFTV